jgi:hypothetical protein
LAELFGTLAKFDPLITKGVPEMSRKSVSRVSLVLPLLFFCLAPFAMGEERVPAGHHCAEDEQGNIVCSKFGGGDAFLDRTSKQIVCGKGHCQVDYYKKAVITCAKTEDGVAAFDRQGRVVCSGGCEPANASMCEKLTP